MSDATLNDSPRPGHLTFAQLADYVDGRLSPEQVRQVEAHLATGCSLCQADLAWLQRTLGAMKDRRWSEPPEWARQRARQLFSRPPEWLHERARALYRERRAADNQQRHVDFRPPPSVPRPIARPSPRWAAVAVGLLLVIASLVLWQRMQPQPASVAYAATLEEVGGAVEVQPSADAAWTAGKKGLLLYSGAGVRTGEGGWALVRFPGNPTVTLRSRAHLVISAMSGSGGQLTALQFEHILGEAEYAIPAISAPGFYYKVTTQAGQVTAAQPTRCTVRVSDDRTTWVSVSEGAVMVSAPGLERTLGAGEWLTLPAVTESTATLTPLPSPTSTPTPTAVLPTATPPPFTSAPTPTPRPPTWTPQPTETAEPEPTETPRPSRTPEPTETEEPTRTPRPTETEEPTQTPRPTETEEPTQTPRPTETEEPTQTPRPTETEEPTQTPRPTQTEEPDPTPDPTHTEEPEPTETDEPPDG